MDTTLARIARQPVYTLICVVSGEGIVSVVRKCKKCMCLDRFTSHAQPALSVQKYTYQAAFAVEKLHVQFLRYNLQICGFKPANPWLQCGDIAR